MIRSVSSGKIKLDSMKVKFPSESLKSLRDDAFTQHLTLIGENGELKQGKKQLDRKSQAGKDVIGLKSVEVWQDFGTLELSAKVLRERYHELVSVNTIEEVVSQINRTGLVTLDPSSFIENAEVLRCDSTSDLHVSQDVGEYLQSLKVIGHLNPKYHARAYKRTGLVLTKEVTSYGERLLLYDKFTEVMRDKNRKILLADRFQGVLRVEANHRELRSIRKRFGLSGKGEIGLMEVLQSKENPNLKIFSSIFDSPDIAKAKAKFDELRTNGEPLHKLEKRIGRENIIADCNYDMKVIRELLKAKYSEGSNFSHVLRQYRELLADMLARDEVHKDERASTFDTDHIGEIRELLRVA